MLNLVFRKIKQPLKLPLMAVMLLWALTLPGQETEVYKFLLSCSTGKPAPEANTLKAREKDPETAQVQQEAVHVFADAKVSQAPSLQVAPAFLPASIDLSALWASSCFSPEQICLFLTKVPASKFLLFSLQPNAP
ncbi:hypothetical protein FHS90_000309 [Rufibacter quisquiliarum]|uniref:Uncharacterized protein n=1 Tax=Rufibacter quisquiliarum TaxID=1549639 RepID=A0A839G9G0_9BACT|nr:hypothetical protein [Rufibacter quisquiliarum]